MKIYTRGGDKGSTSLFSGQRVAKHDLRIAALGDLDELVAALGMAKAAIVNDADIGAELEGFQTQLYLVMADIAGESVGEGRLDSACVGNMESRIDNLSAQLPPLRDFVIPGTTPASAALHLARTVCRRAERTVIAVAEQQQVPTMVGMFLNRLSDLLFTLARWVDRDIAGNSPTFRERL